MTNPYGSPGQYPGGPAYAQPPLPPQPAKKKKKWPWVLGGTVLFFGVIGSMGDSEKPVEVSASTSTSSSAAAKPTLTPAELEAKQQREREAADKAAKDAAAAAERRAAIVAEQEAAAAAKLDPASYERIDDRTFAAIARDPESNKGRKIVIYGLVTQADSVTGNSAFRAETAGGQYWNWYDFDENSMVRVSDPSIISNVLKDDLVEMYVEVKGAMSYNTTIGGKTTVPEFEANIVTVYGNK